MPAYKIDYPDYVTYHTVACGHNCDDIIFDIHMNDALTDTEKDFFEKWVNEHTLEIEKGLVESPDAYAYIVPLSGEATNYSNVH